MSSSNSIKIQEEGAMQRRGILEEILEAIAFSVSPLSAWAFTSANHFNFPSVLLGKKCLKPPGTAESQVLGSPHVACTIKVSYLL